MPLSGVPPQSSGGVHCLSHGRRSRIVAVIQQVFQETTFKRANANVSYSLKSQDYSIQNTPGRLIAAVCFAWDSAEPCPSVCTQLLAFVPEQHFSEHLRIRSSFHKGLCTAELSMTWMHFLVARNWCHTRPLTLNTSQLARLYVSCFASKNPPACLEPGMKSIDISHVAQ